MTAEPRLITLSISPFNELARWSLERSGVAYREEPQPLVWHVIASRRAGGKGTTPVLLANGEVVGESAEIAEWADRHAQSGARLYPDGPQGDEVRALVAHFSNELGPASRRVIWGHLVNEPQLVDRYWGQRLSRRHRRRERLLLRLGKPGVKRALGLDAAQVEAAPNEVRAIFDEVAERLADGRRHLVGDELTAADIAFAAMASPAVLPDQGYPATIMRPDEFPEPVAETIASLRTHPAGAYALQLYRDER